VSSRPPGPSLLSLLLLSRLLPPNITTRLPSNAIAAPVRALGSPA